MNDKWDITLRVLQLSHIEWVQGVKQNWGEIIALCEPRIDREREMKTLQ
jgi:hypothetical protein